MGIIADNTHQDGSAAFWGMHAVGSWASRRIFRDSMSHSGNCNGSACTGGTGKTGVDYRVDDLTYVH